MLALLGVGVYGGYYGFCKYEIHQKEVNFDNAVSGDFRNALMRLQRAVNEEDVRQVVLGFAKNAGIELAPTDVKVIIEPLTPQNMSKLPAVAQTALGIAGQMKNHRAPRSLVGFVASKPIKFKIAKGTIRVERYTWFDDVAQ